MFSVLIDFKAHVVLSIKGSTIEVILNQNSPKLKICSIFNQFISYFCNDLRLDFEKIQSIKQNIRFTKLFTIVLD